MIPNDADEPCAFPHRRRRSHVGRSRFARRFGLRLALALLAAIIAAAGCASGEVASSGEDADADPMAAADGTTAPSFTPEPDTAATATALAETSLPAAPAASVGPTATPHPLIAASTELPPAPIGFEALFEDPANDRRPVSLEIEDIDVTDAVVVPVGVNLDDSTLEVPPADQVGWYRFGSAPGQPGSAVLAAHIAYDGVDGVFRRLEEVDVGSTVVVGFDDGTTLRYRIDELRQYDKDALPDSLWERDGDQRLVLITCGGAFNPDLRSYESNTVAIATPLVG